MASPPRESQPEARFPNNPGAGRDARRRLADGGSPAPPAAADRPSRIAAVCDGRGRLGLAPLAVFSGGPTRITDSHAFGVLLAAADLQPPGGLS